ncbi:AMP-binding protein [Schumannella sp. 10F1B-5-1]|uniref:AMP-binding protein n=1 Tax=Schumannella sp. 10F1B-5-1 TaxID=2590780 RepID=UPI0011312CC2|nr:AMP-binding protein [Schumannella sp. 10F1B-5-1]TPW70645.1 4-coumarate--CoA ligase family protein [Schumannella sp. 10F1B-5-1]
MFPSPFADERIPAVSVFDYLFADVADDDLDRVALIDGPSGAETTYRQLIGQVLALAGALAQDGIGVGDVVALHCPNSPAFATAFHGILRSGATATTVNALFTAEEIVKQLRGSGARLLLTVSPLLEAARAAAHEAGLEDAAIVVLDGAEGFRSLRDLLALGAPAPEVSFDPATHVAVMPYSSGTTGNPKGVMLSHTNLVANVQQCAPVLDIRRDDRLLAVLPFFHIYGMTVLLDLALSRRAALVTMPRFDFVQFLELIQSQRLTFLFIAPPIGVALAKHPLVDQYVLSSVRGLMSGAAPFDTALGEAVQARTGARVQQGYGMSESSPVSHVIPPDRHDIPIGSIGVPIANVQCKLIDVETGDEITELDGDDGRSRSGELWMRGPNIMLGYLGDPEATAATVDAEGYLHTGDIAQVGPLGEFYIVDRLKELIKYKGYQVPPAELEALLLTHPEISDAAVVGAADEEAGEVPKAFVVRIEGSTLDEQAVMDFTAEHVAPYKRVRQVAFIDAVPKSTAGKILRKELRGR